MINVIPYLVKSGICLLVCYGFFYFILRRDKAFIFNRVYLLATLILSVLMPFVNVTIPTYPIKSTLPVVSQMLESTSSVSNLMHVNQTATFNWYNIFFVMLILVTAFFLAQFLYNLIQIIIMISSGEQLKVEEGSIVLIKKDIAPHSFLRFMFVNKEMYELGLLDRKIIEHEKVHCHQLHSLDILLVEVLKILFWWHPSVWLYKKS